MTQGLASKLKILIEEKKVSVQGLEQQAGLKTNAVRNILRGLSKKPSADLVMSIAKALDYPVGDLLGEKRANQEDTPHLKEVSFSCHALLGETLAFIVKMYADHKEEVNAQDLFALTQEIYTYSQESTNGKLDQKFAQWLLKKQLL